MATLSLCVIAKNEEAVLGRLFASAASFVDEIVLCDTGSTDRTIEIARGFDAKVVFAPFEDDFSAPRNVSLAAASSDWILVLDADEWLDEGSGRVIRQAIENRRVAGYYLRFENRLGKGRVHRCGLMRLFRNDASVRFEFAIHEQVLPRLIGYAKRRGLKLAPLDAAVVIHDGYLDERMRDRGKNERNLRLFERQVRQHPDHAYSWYKFGDFLRRFPDRRAEAIAALEHARTLITRMGADEARELSFGAEVYTLLAIEADRDRDPNRALSLLEEGRARFAESPNMLHVLGHVLARNGDHRGSFRAYARLRLADRRLHAVPPEPGITGPYAYFAMARALRYLGHRRAAIRCLDEAVRLDDQHFEARTLRARSRLEDGDLRGAIEDHRAAAESRPTDAATHARLASALLAVGEPESAAREFGRAIEHGVDARAIAGPHGQALLAAGRLEDALDRFASNPEDENCALGLKLLDCLASGADPIAEPAFRTPTGRAWLATFAHCGVPPEAATVGLSLENERSAAGLRGASQ